MYAKRNLVKVNQHGTLDIKVKMLLKWRMLRLVMGTCAGVVT
jgi:hypothetical protein